MATANTFYPYIGYESADGSREAMFVNPAPATAHYQAPVTDGSWSRFSALNSTTAAMGYVKIKLGSTIQRLVTARDA